MKLLTFPQVPLIDIPDRLRLLAKQIEDGVFGTVQNVITVIEDTERVRSVSFGQSDDAWRTYAILHFAANIVVSPGE